MTTEIQWEWTWSGLAAVLFLAFLTTLVFSLLWSPAKGWRRYGLGVTKALAVTLLLACLLNPTVQMIEPRPGENLLLVAVDQSRSLDLNDASRSSSSREKIRSLFDSEQTWLNRLEEDYNVQFFGIGEQLRAIERDEAGQGTDTQSNLFSQLEQLSERFEDRPVAGVIVATDGLATDTPVLSTDRSTTLTSPIFPVLLGDKKPPVDLSIEEVVANPTNFETTPLIVTAKLKQVGLDQRSVVVAVLDQNDDEFD